MHKTIMQRLDHTFQYTAVGNRGAVGNGSGYSQCSEERLLKPSDRHSAPSPSTHRIIRCPLPSLACRSRALPSRLVAEGRAAEKMGENGVSDRTLLLPGPALKPSARTAEVATRGPTMINAGLHSHDSMLSFNRDPR